MKIKRLLRKIKRWIVDKEPTSSLSKVLIVWAYKLALIIFGRYKKRKESAMEVIEELMEEGDNPNKLFNQILYCRFMYRISAKEYFVFDFAKLSHEGRKTFLTRGNKYPFYKKFNQANYTAFFNQKTETYRKFHKFYNRDVLCMYDASDYDKFLEFIDKHSKFIYKPSDDYGGHGIKIYDADHFDSKKDLFEIILSDGYCVLEELIVQGQAIAQFHPESVNTTRIVAFLTPTEEVKILWTFLRMGMGDNHTDNMSAGGLAAMIDPLTGIIYTTGRDWLGKKHIAHPDTGIQLVGYQMPEWDTLMKLVEEIAKTIPQVRLVGWDFAYTDKGWTFVEGNARPQCVSAQITDHNGKFHLYEEMNDLLEDEEELDDYDEYE